MCKKFLLILLFAQTALFPQSVKFYFGYTGYDLSEQKAQFENIVYQFNSSSGLNIPVKTNLPSNYVFSGSIAFKSTGDLEAGITFFAGKTNSYALYGDILGNIDFKASYDMYLLGGYLQAHVSSSDFFNMSVGADLYLGTYDFKVDASVSYPDFPQYNSSSSDSYSGNMLCGEPYLAFDFKIFPHFFIASHFGLRIGTTIRSNDDDNRQPIPMSPNGFTAMIGLGYSL